MIEILVTVLMLSFGLLGMSALQSRALQGSVSSLQRSQAVIFSQYMLDVMRIDRENAKGGSYNTPRICAPNAFNTPSFPDTSRREWLQLVQGDMGSTACTVITCDSKYVCSVQIEWDDSKAGGLANQTVTVSSRV
jgi:type IV pilus assembly protein PilV